MDWTRMRGLPDALISQGSSSISFLRQLGGAAGVSGVGIVRRIAKFGLGFVLLVALTACGAGGTSSAPNASDSAILAARYVDDSQPSVTHSLEALMYENA